MQPNFLLLILDCTRADHMSCYGYGRETSPFMDSLARRGTRFANMVSSAPWTLPSHASLFTGMYSASHGATDEHRYLAADFPMIGQLLQEAGYSTGAFCGNPWVSPETGFERGFERFYTNRPAGRLGRPLVYAQKAVDVLLRRRDSGSLHTNRAVTRWVQGLPAGSPFFAFVHYNETHLHFHPPEPYLSMFLENGDTPARIRGLNQDCNAYIAGAVDMSDDDFRLLTALYDAEMRYADSRVQQLAEMLDAVGRLDDTVIIISADHGENLGDHGMMSHKFCVYETLLRVPLVISGPGVPPGSVSEELVQNVDVMPTVAGLAGIDEARYAHASGKRLFVDGEPQRGHEYVFSERYRPNLASFQRRFADFDTTPVDVRRRSVSDGRLKLIWSSDGNHELYDLATDPGEEANLYDLQRADADALHKVLESWLAGVERAAAGDEDDPEFDELARAQLEGLGYID